MGREPQPLPPDPPGSPGADPDAPILPTKPEDFPNWQDTPAEDEEEKK